MNTNKVHDPKNKECHSFIGVHPDCANPNDPSADVCDRCTCQPSVEKCPECQFEDGHSRGCSHFKEQEAPNMQGDIETCSKHYVKDCAECFEAPTSVTGDEWAVELQFGVMEDYLRDAEMGKVAIDKAEHAEAMRNHFHNLQGFIRNLLLAQRTHLKQALREKILIKIVPSKYEHLPEHARAGAVLQDILHIVNEELA